MLGICRGIMASLRYIEPMRKAVQIVLEQNEKFFFAGPHRMLGRLYHQAPGWPISIGSKAKAAEHLERSVSLAPTFLNNRLFLAEFYLDVGKKPQAREQIDFILGATLNPDHQIEDGGFQQEARKLRSLL
jgi:hypothetical protein